ncbi:hypothetical protein [Actinoplanes sp. M2I2]|uniref:hypothetical protein n=1 Tax=Actinoplanes sp. M2I2 TaxID=1734444 RepID=UPI002021A9C1|nr:hypothetical protein [Actinoplanes sp. M2I2]
MSVIAPRRTRGHWMREPWPRTVEGEVAALRVAFPLWEVEHRADADDGFPFRATRPRADGSHHGRLAYDGRGLGLAMEQSEAEPDLW